MDLSVVVPTLNGRDRLAACLDTLAEQAADAEVVVVNGPSTDGTTGFVREHAAANVLIEVAERNINAARNAGITAATGEAVALLGQDSAPEPGWLDAVRTALADGATAVTGPVHRAVDGGLTTQQSETRRFAGREVTFFDGGNVAFAREALNALDGFDEYLDTGGARDAAHRLAGMGFDVTWRPDVAVLRTDRDDVPDRLARDADAPVWGVKHRALAYRFAKNYGARPSLIPRILRHASTDALTALRSVFGGDTAPSTWAGGGRAVAVNLARGFEDGLRARAADPSPTRNPHGASRRDAVDRPVARYEC